MQGPHPFRRHLTGDQPLQFFRQRGRALFPHQRMDACDFKPQGRRLGMRIAAQHGEQIEHVPALAFVHPVLGADSERIGQHHGQHASP